MKPIKKFTVADLVLIILIAGAGTTAPVFYRTAPEAEGAMVEIQADGRTVCRVPLKNTDTTLTVRGRTGPSVLEVQDGHVRFVRSACPNKHCIRSGSIHEPGAWLLCLPNRVLVRITGPGGGESLDGVTR